jgi:protein O-mannosyl-transferase
MSPPQRKSLRKNRKIVSALRLLLIPVLIAIAYAASICAPFVYDDEIHIVENRDVIAFQSVTDLHAVRGLLEHPFGLAARPLLFLTYGLNYAAFGLTPAAYRLTNYAIHLANSFLVYFIVFELARIVSWTEDRCIRAGLLAGSLFAVHPLLTESVTYIAGRSSSLCATFYFAGLFAVMRGANARGRSRALLLSVVVVSTLAGWLVKQDAIALPIAGIVLVWLTWPALEAGRSRWIATAVLLTPAVLLVILQLPSLRSVTAVSQANAVLTAAGFEKTPEFWTYLWTSLREWTGYYFWRLFIPVRLNIDPQVALVDRPSMSVLASLAWMLGLTGSVLWLRRRHLFMSAGIALTLISPLAVYCIFPLADVVAEHRAYITVLGSVIVLTAIILSMPRSLVFSCIMTVAFTWQTRERNGVWTDAVRLWQDAERQAEDKVRPHFNLAGLYRTQGKIDRAVAEYDWIIRHHPGHPAAVTNLASMYVDANDLTKAEALLAPVIGREIQLAPAYSTLGIVRIRQHRFDEAQTLLRQAIQINPAQPLVHHNLGDVFVNQGKLENAIREYLEELQLNPNSLPTHLNLAKTYEMAGMPEKAKPHYRFVQRLKPDNSDVRNALIRLQ